MPTNDFKPVADAGGANVLTQSQYLALTAYLNNGFSSGIVPSNQINKTLRQTSVMAYVLAEYIAQQSGQNVLDNGTPATIIANLLAAVQASASATTFVTQPFGDTSEKAATDLFVARAVGAVGGYYQDTGSTANAYVVTTIPPWTAGTYANGFSLRFRTTRANTGAVTLNAGTPGAFPITQEDGGALEAGDIPTGSISTATFSTASNTWVYNGAVPSDFLTSPALRGVPTAPTPAPGTNNTQIPTTAFVQSTVGLAAAPYRPLSATQTLSFGNFIASVIGGGFNCPLNASPATGDGILILCARGNFAATPLTLTATGGKVFTADDGSTDTILAFDANGAEVLVWYDGATWRLF